MDITKNPVLYAAATYKKNAMNMIFCLPEAFDILVTHDTITNIVLQEQRKITYKNQCYHCAYRTKEPFAIQVPKRM